MENFSNNTTEKRNKGKYREVLPKSLGNEIVIDNGDKIGELLGKNKPTAFEIKAVGFIFRGFNSCRPHHETRLSVRATSFCYTDFRQELRDELPVKENINNVFQGRDE